MQLQILRLLLSKCCIHTTEFYGCKNGYKHKGEQETEIDKWKERIELFNNHLNDRDYKNSLLSVTSQVAGSG